MVYNIINNRGVLNTYETITVDNTLDIVVDGIDGIMKIIVDHSYPRYVKPSNGVYKITIDALHGNISICIIDNNGVVYPLQPLIAVRGDDGVTVIPDARAVFDRLASAEKCIHIMGERIADVDAKYNDLKDRIDRLFTQNYY